MVPSYGEELDGGREAPEEREIEERKMDFLIDLSRRVFLFDLLLSLVHFKQKKNKKLEMQKSRPSTPGSAGGSGSLDAAKLRKVKI